MTAVQELVDAKIAAVEARTDVKFGQLIGEIQLINQRFDHLEGQMRSIRSNIWAATSIVIGSMIGIIAILATVIPWTFDLGVASRDVIARELAVQAARK